MLNSNQIEPNNWPLDSELKRDDPDASHLSDQPKDLLSLSLKGSEMRELKEVTESVTIEKDLSFQLEISTIGEKVIKEVLVKMDCVIKGQEEKLETNEQQVLFWFLTNIEKKLIQAKNIKKNQNSLTEIQGRLERIYQLKIRMTEARTGQPINILREKTIEELSNTKKSGMNLNDWKKLQNIVGTIRGLQDEKKIFENLKDKFKLLEAKSASLDRSKKTERETTRGDSALIDRVRGLESEVDQLSDEIDKLKTEIFIPPETLSSSNQKLSDWCSHKIGIITGMINNLEKNLMGHRKKIDEMVFKSVWGLKKF